MKKMLTLIILVMMMALNNMLFGQTTFTSATTGNWDQSSTWTLTSGSDSDGIPDADDNVIIQASHIITVEANKSMECLNLTVAGGSATSVSLAGENSTLTIYGSISATTAPSAGNYIDCTADATAKVIFKRSTSGAIVTGTWGTFGEKVRCEVDLGAGIVGTSASSLKFRELIVKSGTLSITGDLRPDAGSANTGKVTIKDGGVLIVTVKITRTGTVNTPFESFVIEGNGKLVINGNNVNALPSLTLTAPVNYTFSDDAIIEIQGASQTIPDINYPNLVINASTNSTPKTYSPGANRTAKSIYVKTGILAFGNGVQWTVSGNIVVDEGATIGPSSSSNKFLASGLNRQFVLNGIARVVRNKTQTSTVTNSFVDTYDGFSVYSFGDNSWLSFRNPTSSVAVEFLIGPVPTGTAYGNIEFAVVSSSVLAATYTITNNIEIKGNLAFPSVATTPAAQTYNFQNYIIKVGKKIQLDGVNLNSGTNPTRTYNNGASTIELNGTSEQITLGGANLPNSFYNLKLNNTNKVTVENAITVDNNLELSGNGNYQDLNKISGYNGLVYSGSVPQMIGDEINTSINNLTISNLNGVSLDKEITISNKLLIDENCKLTATKTLTSSTESVINGTFQIGQGGWATGSNFTYGENGVLEFANTTGSYGVNNTDVFWPTTNGPKNVNVSGSAGITLNAARTIDGLLQTAATIVNANNLTINGTLQINPNGWLNSSPTYGSNSTLTYKAGYNLSNEWISGSEVGVGIPKNVIIDSETEIVGIPDGSGLRTIKGNLTITSGTFKLGNSIGDDLTIQGNFTNNGSFNPNNRLVTFNGSGLQQVTGQTDFDYFTLNNSTDLQINSNTTINQNLNLLQGRIITGENTLVIANNAGVSKTDGYVIGNLRKYFTNSNKSRNFEIGTDNGYSPLNVTFNNITVDGYLSVNSKQVVHPSVVNSNESLNRYWSITNNNLEFDSYSMVLSYLSTDFNNVQFVEATDEPTIVVGKFNAGEWTFPTISNRNTTDNTIEISSVTSFSDFTIGKNAAALPVELSNFVASFKNNLVTLTWQTATEINSYCFEVERSNDNTTWVKIGSVNAGGNSNKVLNYEYFDNITTDGKYYYRLKQIDLDGSFKYTSIVEVNAVMPIQYSLSQNYPNPFNPTTKINYSIPVNAKVTLNIYSITGELVTTLVDEDLAAGNYTIDFDASRLASGTYFYRIIANDFVQTKKMILIK